MVNAKKAKGKSARSSAKGPVAEIGVIGGSGLYAMSGLTDTREIRVKTPFGDPSDPIVVGTLGGKRVAFLTRHGHGAMDVGLITAAEELMAALKPPLGEDPRASDVARKLCTFVEMCLDSRGE